MDEVLKAKLERNQTKLQGEEASSQNRAATESGWPGPLHAEHGRSGSGLKLAHHLDPTPVLRLRHHEGLGVDLEQQYVCL